MHRILHEEVVGAEIMRGNAKGHLMFYERMMMQVPGSDDNIDEETMCRGCQLWEKGGNFYGLHRSVQGTHHVFFQWLLQSRHTLCRYQRMA